MTGRTDYERFAEKADRRRRLKREELAIEVTEAIVQAMARAGISRVELAQRMGRTKGFVTQILTGGRNLTVGTIAEVADALDSRVTVGLVRMRDENRARRTRASAARS